jgi:hypothetical protein
LVNSYEGSDAAQTKLYTENERLVCARIRGRFAQPDSLLVTIAGKDAEPLRAGAVMLSD